MIQVKVGKMPGEIKDYGLNAGSTVQEALTTAGILVTDNYSIEVNKVSSSLTDTLNEGDVLLLLPQVKGN